jgi:hypothetical protein
MPGKMLRIFPGGKLDPSLRSGGERKDTHE